MQALTECVCHLHSSVHVAAHHVLVRAGLLVAATITPEVCAQLYRPICRTASAVTITMSHDVTPEFLLSLQLQAMSALQHLPASKQPGSMSDSGCVAAVRCFVTLHKQCTFHKSGADAAMKWPTKCHPLHNTRGVKTHPEMQQRLLNSRTRLSTGLSTRSSQQLAATCAA